MLAVEGRLFFQSLGTAAAAIVVVAILRGRDNNASRQILWRKAFHLLVVVLFLPVQDTFWWCRPGRMAFFSSLSQQQHTILPLRL